MGHCLRRSASAFLAYASVAGCTSGNPDPIDRRGQHAATWAPPPPARCNTPAGELLEYSREAPDAELLGTKTLGGAGQTQIRYYANDCRELSLVEVAARITSAANARRALEVNSIGDEQVMVQIWLGSRREYGHPLSLSEVDAERDRRAETLPSNLRATLTALSGSFALVGTVSRQDALALAALEQVRLFFVYPRYAASAARDVTRALALSETPANSQGTIAVFDDCAEGVSALPAHASFADAAGATCLGSTHGSRVSALAFAGLPEGARRLAAGLTMVTTDAPESLAAPALWAIQRQNTDVLVQTIHIGVFEGANDALDMLLTEAAYGRTLIVRASGNGDPKEAVVHRIAGALDVGGVDNRDAPLMSMRMVHPYSVFGDRRGVPLLDNGIVTDLDGSSEGTSFSAPRTAATALRMLAGLVSSPFRPLGIRARILGWARPETCAIDWMEPPSPAEDSACGSGITDDLTGAGAALRGEADDRIAERLGAHATTTVEVRAPASAGSYGMRAALAFEVEPGTGWIDALRPAADLDLRVINSAGETVANAQSFDSDQEVTTWPAAGGDSFRVVVERLGGNAIRHAVLAWSAKKK